MKKLIYELLKTINKTPKALVVIIFLVGLLNSIVPTLWQNNTNINSAINKLNSILDNTYFDSGKLKESSEDFLKKNEYVYFGRDNDKNYIRITENEVIINMNGKLNDIQFKNDYKKEELAKELKNICISYSSMSTVSVVFFKIIKIMLLYSVIIITTQFITRRRLKARELLKPLIVCTLFASVICFFVWKLGILNESSVGFLNILCVSILYTTLISESVKKCITNDYLGERIDSNDIY